MKVKQSQKCMQWEDYETGEYRYEGAE